MTFEIGKTYHDLIGRKWKILKTAYDSEGNSVFIVRNWKKGLCLAFQDYEGAATIVYDDGFTTIYTEEDE